MFCFLFYIPTSQGLTITFSTVTSHWKWATLWLLRNQPFCVPWPLTPCNFIPDLPSLFSSLPFFWYFAYTVTLTDPLCFVELANAYSRLSTDYRISTKWLWYEIAKKYWPWGLFSQDKIYQTTPNIWSTKKKLE